MYAVLQQLFSVNPSLSDKSNLGFGHYLAVIVVAAGIGFYHWNVLRADAAARPARVVAAPAVVEPVPMLIVPAPAETQALDAHTHRYTLVVTDATDDDVHQALAALPPQASYKLIPGEPATVDGH